MLRFRFGSLAAPLAVVLALAFAVAAADARVGGSRSSGSRGSNTYTAPPATQTAPTAAQPMQRTQQPAPSAAQQRPAAAPVQPAQRPGLFNRPGFMGGLLAGFLGAGLLGLLMGNGLLGGLGGLASMLGLLLQVGLVALVAYLAISWWRRRNAPAHAMASGPSMYQGHPGNSGGYQGNPGPQPVGGFGFGQAPGPQLRPIEIGQADYEAFERLLGEIQAAYGREDHAALAERATPEMLSYFTEDLAENARRGLVSRVSDVKLLQGDLSEAWAEGDEEYATVAMRFSLIDATVERATGRVVEGDPTRPQEVTEVWTFVRHRGREWQLSAIQQV